MNFRANILWQSFLRILKNEIWKQQGGSENGVGYINPDLPVTHHKMMGFTSLFCRSDIPHLIVPLNLDPTVCSANTLSLVLNDQLRHPCLTPPDTESSCW